MTTKQATQWIKSVFSVDISLIDNEDGFEKGYLRLMPLMEAEPFILIYNYYSGDNKTNISREGTGNRLYIEVSKFVKLFAGVIDVGKSIEDNIISMILLSKEKNLGMVSYLNLCLDRIKYPNFVDVRMIFNKLYIAYEKSYDPEQNIDNRSETLAEIRKACLEFQEFVEETEEKRLLMESAGKEYIKEFFDYAVA